LGLQNKDIMLNLNLQSTRVFTAILALVVMGGVGCTTTDPEYRASEQRASSNLPADAVVGTWFGKSQVNQPGMVLDAEGVMVFKADGTGYRYGKGRMTQITSGTQNMDSSGAPLTFKWKYLGDGTWEFSPDESHILTFWIARIRIADGRMLLHGRMIVPTIPIMGWGLMQYKEIFVRATSKEALEEERLRDNRNVL